MCDDEDGDDDDNGGYTQRGIVGSEMKKSKIDIIRLGHKGSLSRDIEIGAGGIIIILSLNNSKGMNETSQRDPI